MALPVGSIIMFYDAIANRPTGWEICDGTNGTPDLRSKFVYAASADGEVGATGGATTHSHTNSPTNDSSGHTHPVSSGLGWGGGTTTGGTGSGISVANAHGHSGSTTSDSGGVHSHTINSTSTDGNLPPYVKIYYIMRTV